MGNGPLFDTDFDPTDLIDQGEDVVHIDTESLGEEAQSEAEEFIKTLTSAYYDEGCLADNPSLKKRVAAEVESLRLLVKMRKSSEIIHDLAIKAIGGNSGNASLYRAASETQKTLMSIHTKIDETVDRLTNMLKNYQLEINFEGENKEGDEQPSDAHRGSKDFIEEMRKEID